MLKRLISFLAQLWRSHFSLAALFLLGISLNWAIAACNNTPSPTSSASPAASPTATPAKVVRIGHHSFDPFTPVKARGGLEKRLQPLGVSVEWKEFQSGPPMLLETEAAIYFYRSHVLKINKFLFYLMLIGFLKC